MANNEELGKLSPEQVQKLANTLSEAKNLTSQQAEVIEQVLKGEEDIGKLRMSYLKEYFDTYSKNLDLVARKYAQTASEVKELSKARSDQVNEEAKAKALNDVKKRLEEKRLQLEFEAREKHRGRLLKKDAAEIEKQLAKEFEISKKNLNKLTAERFEKEKQLRALTELKKTDPTLAAEVSRQMAERRAELEYDARSKNNGRLAEKEAKAIEAQLQNEFSLQESQLNELAKKRFDAEERIRDLKKLSESDPELAKAYEEKRIERKRELELAAMRRNNGIISEEERKSINKTLANEFQLRSEQSTELLKELNQKRLEGIALENLKKENPALAEAIEKKRADLKARLEYEAKAKNDGRLLQKDIEDIEKKVQLEYSLTEENLKKLAAEKFNEDRFELESPEVAAARKAKIQKEIYGSCRRQARKNTRKNY